VIALVQKSERWVPNQVREGKAEYKWSEKKKEITRRYEVVCIEPLFGHQVNTCGMIPKPSGVNVDEICVSRLQIIVMEWVWRCDWRW